MKKIVAFLLAAVMVFGLANVAFAAEQEKSAESYSYTVTPLLSPFAYYVFVKTDNPDPYSFRLADRSSKYFTAEDKGQITQDVSYGYSYYVETEPGLYYVCQKVFADVVYESPEIFRVKGGYIFRNNGTLSDGGELVLLKRTQKGSSFLHDVFAETKVKISCPKMTDRVDYLINTYTTASMSFFEKMDAVQQALDQITIYPRGVYDSEKPSSDRPYPLLAASPYPELILNEHYDMFERYADGILLSTAYPFVLDSLGFPSTESAVAKKLNPSATVEWGTYHYLINVTDNGTTKTYGGAGIGGYDPLYTKSVKKAFTFSGSSDLGLNGTVEGYYKLLREYQPICEADAAAYYDMIQGTTFKNKIKETGGTWARIGVEGWGYGTGFCYIVPRGSGYEVASDAWVDGKYVNKNECVEMGTTFSDHPTADLVVHDVSYIDINGKAHTQDVVFSYYESSDTWRAPYYYTDSNWYASNMKLPEELILTREEIEEMGLLKQNFHLPTDGLVYDGTEYPGTPFHVTSVTGVTMPPEMTLAVGTKRSMRDFVTVTPENATYANVTWQVSDSSAAEVTSEGYLTVKTAKTFTLTVTTVDGGYTASCTITVTNLGDVDNSGKVNASDALMALKAAVGKITLTDEQQGRADVNGDGKINSVDALMILKYAVGKISTFPAAAL